MFDLHPLVITAIAIYLTGLFYHLLTGIDELREPEDLAFGSYPTEWEDYAVLAVDSSFWFVSATKELLSLIGEEFIYLFTYGLPYNEMADLHIYEELPHNDNDEGRS